MKVYRLEPESGKYKNIYLSDDTDIELRLTDYFDFRGKPKMSEWSTPEVYLEELEDEDVGTQPVPDIAGFRPDTLVLSQRAADLFSPYLKDTVELLPMNCGWETCAVNVLNVVNAVDYEQSEIQRDDDGDFIGMNTTVIDPNKVKPGQLFKIPEDNRTTILYLEPDNSSDDLIALIKKHGLTGLRFVEANRWSEEFIR